MSTDDERPDSPDRPAVPRTRAELRAAREAAAAAAEAASVRDASAPVASVSPVAPVELVAAAPAAPLPAEPAPVSPSVESQEAARISGMAPERTDGDSGFGTLPSTGSDASLEGPRRSRSTHRALNPRPSEEPAAAPASVPAPASPESATSGSEPSSASDTLPGPRRGGAAGSNPTPASDDARDARGEAEVPQPSSTEGSRPGRRFGLALAAVLGILVLVGAGLGFVSLTQGPRITQVQVDPAHAIESSGSRVILTANQSLTSIDDSQVTVDPAVPFTVDAAGRGIGIRFTVPLDDSTTYTVKVADVQGTGGGPSATLRTSFTTPESKIFLLNRDADKDDQILLTDHSGKNPTLVFSADKINDFRATSTQIVVSVEEDDLSTLYVMDRDGTNKRKLPLPGKGYIGSIQVSDRGGLVGYTYSDQDLSDTEGRASVLVTQSLTGDSTPQIVTVSDKEASILTWQFVPDSAAMLFIDFDGALSLIDHSSDAGVQPLGLASDILGITRGTYTAIVERVDGSVVDLNLADGSEQPLAASDPDYGTAIAITPFPGGTLRRIPTLDDTGLPVGQVIVKVDDDGTATKIAEVGASDAILQACASPSGRYAAIAIAPDLTDNPYDQMLLPLPQRIETHLIDLRTGDELVALRGFDASWCQTAPHY